METVFHTIYVFLAWTAVVAVTLLAVIWISRTAYLYVRSQIDPGQEIVVGTFTTVGEGLPNDAKAVGAALASKLERLKRLATRESGFGLVHGPVLTSVPELFTERQSAARKRLETLNLKVKDIDVNTIVGLVRSTFEPARPTLEGQVTTIGDRTEIRAELMWKGDVLRSWAASRPTTAKPAESLNVVYDDLLFQIIYDLSHASTLPWFAKPGDAGDMPNWQSLEAMTLGLDALDAYEQTSEYSDLKRAIDYLERVQVHAPGHALGHYFLAIALSENRQEIRAASLLSQIDQLEASQLLKWSAALQRAGAMLRQYTAAPAEQAVTDALLPLIKDLDDAINPTDPQLKLDENASAFATRLRPMAYAQLAYTYATLLTLHSRKWSAAELRNKSQEAADNAFVLFDEAAKSWPADLEHEKKEVDRWRYNARGYSRFRIAQSERHESAAAGKPTADEEFRKRCEIALGDLRKANEILANNYEVLQNQAMILDDETYDPAGAKLVEAEALYERTKLFVPNDYYQYERLAWIYWRQLRQTPPISVVKDLATKGSAVVGLAQTYRLPAKSGKLAGLAAYFAAVQARVEDAADKKRQRLTESIGSIDAAIGNEDPAPDVLREAAAAEIEAVAATLGDKDEADKTAKTKAERAAEKLKPKP